MGLPAHDGNPSASGLAALAGPEVDIGAETAPASCACADDPDPACPTCGLDSPQWREPIERPIVDQPPPAPSAGPAIWDLVIADMRERDRVGRARYGTPLRAFNGRDAKVDAYQEILDAAVYLRQDIEEDRELRAAATEALAVADAVAHAVATDGCVLPELCARAAAARERLRCALARLPAPEPTSEAP